MWRERDGVYSISSSESELGIMTLLVARLRSEVIVRGCLIANSCEKHPDVMFCAEVVMLGQTAMGNDIAALLKQRGD